MSTIEESSFLEEISDSFFLRENKLIKLLPNYHENEIYADSLLSEIIENFKHSIKEKLFFDSFNYNLKLLRRYIKIYSLRFTKEQYVFIIQTLYDVLVQKEIDVVITLNVIVELKTLLSKSRCLSRDDLCVEWKPLYEIWYYHTHSSKAKNGIICTPKSVKEPLTEVIHMFSCFFPMESTEQIWMLARPYLLYPYLIQPDKHNGLKILKLLLPFYYNNKEPFFRMVWPQLTRLLTVATWSIKTEHDIMGLLARAGATHPDQVQWPVALLDRAGTALLRALRIKVAGCARRTRYSHGTRVYVDLLVAAIHGDGDVDGDCAAIARFRRLFQAIGHLFHPSSHTKDSTGRLLNLLYQVSAALLIRYQNERVKRPLHSTFGNYPKEYHLTDTHIKTMVGILLPCCEFAIFTKAKTDFGAVLSSVQKLSCLCPEVMVPACLKLFHETSGTVLEPHRALSTLATVSMLHVPLLTSVNRYPEGKLAVFPLMRQLITYININDPPKSYISIICFGNLANILWMEDLSDRANDNNLTPFEKEVALATAQFEDLVLQFFDKLFEIIDIGFSESEMVESQRNSDFRTEALTDALVMVIPNISDAISQEVLDKTIDFVSSHSFLSEQIQQFFGTIFSCLLEREEVAVKGLHKFMPQYMRYFRGLVTDDCMVIHEKLDFKFVWLSSMLPDFIKGHLLALVVDDVMEVLLALCRVNTFDSYKIVEILLSYSLNFCTHPSASLGIVAKFRDRNFHLNSWSGIITKADLCASDRYAMTYRKPGTIEDLFVQRIIAEVIGPALERLREVRDVIGQAGDDRRIGNKELRSICKVLLTVLECHPEYLVPEDVPEDRFPFEEEHGPLATVATPPQPPLLLGAPMLIDPVSGRPLLAEIKAVARETIALVLATVPRLPLPASDLEDLFHLLRRSHDVRGGAFFSGQNRSFLDRRFESFSHPLRRAGNTMLNWVLSADDLDERRFRPRPRPLSRETVAVADILLAFVGLADATLQRAAGDCLYGLLAGHAQLDEYLVHRALLLATSKTSPIDEHLHRGLAQLLVKVLENKAAHESICFLYKSVAVFVALGRSPHVDLRIHRQLHSKMFDLLVQLMAFFSVSVPEETEANRSIVEARTRLYQSCLEYCLDCYLDASPPGEDAPLFARSLLSCSLSSTTTWQSIYQMSIILPLHVELPIPLRFLELFLLILFSPSKELSSQGCNQLNIIVWLLRRRRLRARRSPEELGLPTLAPDAAVETGPRPDNRQLAVETDTDYWGLPESARVTSLCSGYLWWPEAVKVNVRVTMATEDEEDRLQGSNRVCWALLERVFSHEDFCGQLGTFLLDLGAQTLREEDACQAAPAPAALNHQFAVDHLVNSVVLCLGFRRGLALVSAVFERLLRCSDSNQVYANRMAVQLLSGLVISQKHWTEEENRSFFSVDLLSLIDLYLDLCLKGELRAIGKSLVDLVVLQLVDCRQLLPAYRHMRSLLAAEAAHDSGKEAACLFFLRSVAKTAGWRAGGSLAEDLGSLWRQFVASPVERLRREAAKAMKHLALLPLLSNQFLFCGETRRASLARFMPEVTQLLAGQTRLVLAQRGLQASLGTIQALRPEDLDVVEEDLETDSSLQVVSETTSPTETPPNEPETGGEAEAAPDKVVSAIVSGLTAAFVELDEFASEELLRLFFICLDLVPVRDKMHVYTHVRHCAVVVASLSLAGEEPSPAHPRLGWPSIFSSISQATCHRSWRVRLIAVKMLQIAAFNNLFVVVRAPNCGRLLSAVCQLISDPQLEVRKEAAVALSGLLQCSLLPPAMTPSLFLAGMVARLAPGSLLATHSGVLGLCAFIQAHPHDIPPELPEALTVLCRHVNRPEPICGTVRDTLMRFKKSHQDSWHLERAHFTEDQLCALTDVLVSPSYYA